MRPTITFLQEKFNHFNSLCFGGKLPQVSIRLSHARTFGGRLSYTVNRRIFAVSRYSSLTISISTLHEFSESEYEDILIHEMIHLYILTKGIKDTSPHGEQFRSIMQHINDRYGRHITVSKRYDASSQDTRRRRHLVCVSQLTNGHTGITVSTTTSIFQLWDKIARHPLVSQTSWYSTTDPYFNRFPRSRTLKIYKANPEEVALHLAKAHKLRNNGQTISVDTTDLASSR